MQSIPADSFIRHVSSGDSFGGNRSLLRRSDDGHEVIAKIAYEDHGFVRRKSHKVTKKQSLMLMPEEKKRS